MKVLVIDDSKTMRYVLMKQLNELGYESVSEAENFEGAKKLLLKEAHQLIISDWNMPKGSGLDLLKWVRGNEPTKEIPFIMLTTENDRNKIVEATKAGLQSYLLKPVNKKILTEKLSNLSAAYGFQHPKTDVPVYTIVHDQNDDAPQQLKGKIKPDQIPKLVQSFERIWNNELTVAGFKEWIASEIFVGKLEDKRSDVDLLMKTILSAAEDAISHQLNLLTD